MSAIAALNLSIALMNPGPSRRLGARAFRIASPIVSVLIGPGVEGGELPGGVDIRPGVGAGDCSREREGESSSRESESDPKI